MTTDNKGRPSASRVRQMSVITLMVLLMFGVAAVLAACSNQTVRDLEGVTVTDPDKARLVVNIDTYPNVNAICIEGAGFATTTRDQAGAILRVEAWDAANDGWCGR